MTLQLLWRRQDLHTIETNSHLTNPLSLQWLVSTFPEKTADILAPIVKRQSF